MWTTWGGIQVLRTRIAARAALGLGLILVAVLLSLAPTFAGGGWSQIAPAAGVSGDGSWMVWRGAQFDLVYRSGRLDEAPPDIVAAMEDVAKRAAAFLDQIWPPRDGARLVVVAAPGSAVLPNWLEGVPSLRTEATIQACRETAVREVLRRAAYENAAGGNIRAAGGAREPVSSAIVAGLLDRVDRGRTEVRATAVAIAESRRLASLPQILRWWPSLPLGREQLGSLVEYAESRWGPRGVVALARCLPDWFIELSDVDNACVRALGARAADLDREWTTRVADDAKRIDPTALEAARREVGASLERARSPVVGRAMLLLALGAAVVLALAANRGVTGWALIVFAAAAWLELALFSGEAAAGVKSGVALGEAALVAGWLLLFRRRRPDEAIPPPSRPSPWVEMATALALFAMIMAPRVGLYYYSREIWGKAPMIVLVLMLALWKRSGDPGSIGLGPVKATRLLWVSLLGLVAFRLTTGLTETIYYGVFARITGPVFVWQAYEPWWRAGGFHHYPYVAWTAPKVALDIWDFLFGNFAEELFFRGYLLTRLSRSLGWWKAAFVQAILFGFFHVNYDLFPFAPWPMLFYVLMAAAFGVLMALLFRFSGSLIVPAVVHPLSNLGVLWVGVNYASYHGNWLSYLAYYPLQVVLGLALIPIVLLAGTGGLPRAGGASGWFRRERRPRGPYIEVPGA